MLSVTQAKFDYDAYKAACASQTYDAIMWFKDITIPCNCQALLCICYYHDSLQEDHGQLYIFIACSSVALHLVSSDTCRSATALPTQLLHELAVL